MVKAKKTGTGARTAKQKPASQKPAALLPSAKARKLALELHEMRLEARVIRAKAGLRHLKESAALDYDWVGPWSELIRQRSLDPNWMPVGSVGARRHGTNFPFYQNEQQLAILRDLSRIVVGTNNNAGGLLRGYNSFVIGTGFATKVSAKPGTGERGKQAAARVTAFLDRWAKLNNWSEKQQELGRRTERDGDGILRLFPDDGILKTRFVWPEQVTQPPGYTFEEYGFGIKWRQTEEGTDCEAIESVYVARMENPAEGDHVDAADIVLFQPENDAGVKRRLPLFSFGMREVLDITGRLTRNLGEGGAVREAIAYIRQHAAAGPDEVEEFRIADADFRERRPHSDTYYPVNVWDPGTVVDVPEGMEHAGTPQNPGTAAHSGVVDLLIRSACSKINAPEWLGSSNAANMGAYTSSLVGESPFVKGVVQTQGYYKARFLRVVDRALTVASTHGHIEAEDLELVEVDLVPPSPEVRNKLEEAQRAAIEIPLSVDSRQRYCESQDRDYERIEADNQEYADKFGGPGQPLPMPGGDGQVQTPAPTSDGGWRSESLRESLRESLLESALLEHGFTGEIRTKSGARRKYVDGKEVPLDDAGAPAPGNRAKEPEPHERVNPKTGLADRARVGVPAMDVPPPPAIPRLPNLSAKQAKVEARYAEAYERDPDGFAKKYLKALKKRKVGVAENVFATDDVKALNPDWNPGKARPGEKLDKDTQKAMAKYNTAVHQTANAIAKRAFLQYLDSLPPDKRTVLVTNGGCAAGKGSSLARAEDPDSPYAKMLPAAAHFGAVWDAAGEQNATENEWILEECKNRGIKATFAYVYADPKDTWEAEDRGVIRRAVRKGRMVDARLFADSYAEGAKNMHAFHQKHKDDADAGFIFIDNRKKGAPALMDGVPKEALAWDANAIYKSAVASLEAHKDDLPKALVKGGLAGTKIWGPPT